MTHSNDQPIVKGTETKSSDQPSLESQLDAFRALGSHQIASATLPGDKNGTATAHDARSAGTAALDGALSMGKSTLASTAMGFGATSKSSDEIAERLKHHANVSDTPNMALGVWNMAKNLGSMAAHPISTVTSAWDAGAKVVDTAQHGTTNQKMELIGGGVVLAGSLLLFSGAKMGRAGAEAESVNVAKQGLTEATGARATVTAYREGTGAAAEAALAQAERRAAALDLEKLAGKPATFEPTLAAKPVIEAASPAATTAEAGSRLRVSMESLTPPSVTSRIKDALANPLRALSGDVSATGTGAGKISNLLKEEKAVGSLPSQYRVDGLKTGEVTLPGARHAEVVPSAKVVEPVRQPAHLPEHISEPVNTGAGQVEAKTHVESNHGSAGQVTHEVVRKPVEPPPVQRASAQPMSVETSPAGEGPRVETVERQSRTGQAGNLQSTAHGQASEIHTAQPKANDLAATPEPAPVHASHPVAEVNQTAPEVKHVVAKADHVPVEANRRAVEPAQVPVEGQPPTIKADQGPVEVNRTHVKLDQAPLEADHVSVKADHVVPADANRVPVKGDVVPADANRVPAKGDVVPADANRVPARADVVPADVQHLPVRQNSVGLEAEHVPAQSNGGTGEVVKSHPAANKVVPAEVPTPEVTTPAAAPIKGTEVNLTGDLHPADARPVESRIPDSRPVEVHAADARPVEVHAADARPVEVHAADARPVEVHAADARPVEVHAADARPVEVRAADARPIQVAQPVAETATRAAGNLDNFTQLAGEKGVVLSPDAQRGLQELNSQLKAVSQSSEPLSLAAQNQMSRNLATVEESLIGQNADASVTRQFAELKNSVREVAPAASIDVAPMTENPSLLANRAGSNAEILTQTLSDKGLVLPREAERGLQDLTVQLKAASESGEPLSLAAQNQMSRNLATVEESLISQNADAAVTRQFSELKNSVREVAPAASIDVAPVAESPSVVASRASTSAENLTQMVSDKGLTLSNDAQRGLQDLTVQLKAAAESGEPLSLAAQNQMSRNLATVEESLIGQNADAAVTRQFAELKKSVNEVSAVALDVTPPAEASSVVAGRASSSAEGLSRIVSEKGVALSSDAQRGLQDLSTDLQSVSQSSEPLSFAQRNTMARNMAVVEESLTASGADAAVTRQFNELKASVTELTAPAAAPPVVAQAALTEPAVIATRASDTAEGLSQIARERGVTLSSDAQRSLQDLNAQLKSVSQSGEKLSLTARNTMAQNLATVEESLAVPGTDAAVTRQFNELKASVNELAPAAVGPIAPATEAPAVLASRATEDLQSFHQVVGNQNLTLSGEAEQSLQNVNTQIKALTQTNAVPLTTQASARMAQDLATVERSLTASGADASVIKQFDQVKASVGDLSAAGAEREQLAVLRNSMSNLDAQSATLTGSVRGFSQQLEDTSLMSAADRKIASDLNNKISLVEQKVTQGALTETPLATTGDIQQIVRDIDKPEYSKFFANNPKVARAFEEVKTSTSALATTSSDVESAQIGVNNIRHAEVFQQNVDNLSLLSRDLQSTLPATEAARPVASALKSIENDLATIRTGANPETVIQKVNANIEVIDSAGNANVARELRQNVGQLENTSQALDRTRRLESNISVIRTESSSLESQSARLSQQFGEDAVTAPSTSSKIPVNAQVSEQLQLISRQAKLLDASESGTVAATKIKDAFSRVEDLTAGSTLSAEQTAVLQDMKASIAKIDQATVETTGLRRFENNAARISEQSTRVETLSSNIGKTLDLTSTKAVDAQIEQRLNNITQAAQDVRTARTLDEQVNAANKLATSVQDPELQAYLTRNQSGAASLQELRTSTMDVHESVTYRALERTKTIAAAEAENSVNAARAVEARIQNDIALANAHEVQQAASEYRSAAEAFATAPDKNIAAAQMEQKLDALKLQVNNNGVASTLARSDEMAALYRSQSALSQSVSDTEVLSRSLIERRLPAVEKGFEQIGRVESTAAQRDIMRDISNQLQDLRYLEARSGNSAEQLSLAQMQLTRAQNDLEVATYRSNLVKLAASGDKSAADRLLISGLTSDGFKANSMAAASGPSARLGADFARSHANLQGLTSYNLRSLSSNDALFVNNRNLLYKTINGTGWTLVGAGSATVLTGAVRDIAESRSTRDQTTPSQQIVPAQSVSATEPAVPASIDNRVIGRSASEPNGFSANGQIVARSAFTQDLSNQAIPRAASLLGTTGGADAALSSLSLLPTDSQSLLRPTVAMAGPFTVYNNDVNRDPELYRMQYSGTPFGVKYGGDPIPEPTTVIPFSLAQTLHIARGGGHGAANKGLEKPATSQFVMPSTMLSSPFALAGGVGARPGMVNTRLGGSVFGGAAGSGTRPGDASAKLSSLSEADSDTEEGASAGSKHLKGVERTESKGIDGHVSHASAASANNNGNNDDEDNAVGASASNEPDHDPNSSGAALSPLASDPASRPVPSLGNQDPQAPAVVTAQADEQKTNSNVGAPPRRRPAGKDAISA